MTRVSSFLCRTIKGVDTSKIKSANAGEIQVEAADSSSSSVPRLGVETELEEQLEKVRQMDCMTDANSSTLMMMGHVPTMVVQLNFTPEIEIFCMLFVRSLSHLSNSI